MRQNVLLNTLLERQIASLRNMERSLGELERRMGISPQGYTNMPRVGVFVDVPYVVYAAERLNCNIDFGKLLALMTRGSRPGACLCLRAGERRSADAARNSEVCAPVHEQGLPHRHKAAQALLGRHNQGQL